MKKINLLLAFAFIGAIMFATSTSMYAAENVDLIDVSSKVVNSEFDNATMSNGAPYGWQQTTNAATSKISVAAKGDGTVIFEGENHWQLWNSGAVTGKAFQKIANLPNGKYTLKAGLYTDFSGNIYLYANEGKKAVTSRVSAYLEVVGTVTNGTLEIGLDIATTGGTSIEFDHITLYYQTDNLEEYSRFLEERLAIAVSDTASTQRPGYINIQQMRNAINIAKNAEQTKEALIEAIRILDEAIAEYESIIEAYRPLLEALEELKIKSNPYPALVTVKNEIIAAQAVYDSTKDQRNNIQTTIDKLKSQDGLLTKYKLLKSEITNAERLLNDSDYPNKAVYKTAIDEAKEVFNNPTGKDLDATIIALKNAVTAYLNSRPANVWCTIKNGALWSDDRGRSVQAHGAGFLQIGETWYMIGEDRETAKWNPDVNMYSTKDFINWKFEGKIIKNGEHNYTYPDGTVGKLGSNRMIERPKLLHCGKTGQYVIWCHWEAGNYGASEAAVFYSDDITGPYKLHWAGRPLGIKSRDCNVFQDDDGKAYFISTTNENSDLGLFELSDDYLSAVKHTKLFSGQGREAPAIVKVDGTYFMISSACTGWDPNQAKISYSKSLTSGWSSNQNIGNSISFDTQAASILTISGTQGTSYVYVGDRWQDPDLAESKTIMFPISFSGNSCTFTYRALFDLNFVTGKWRDTSKNRYVPKTNWKIHDYSSQETSGENGAATNVIDGNTSTKWHTKYSGGTAEAPHHISIDMGAEYEITGFLCTSRIDNSNNGLIRNYLCYISLDGKNWKIVSGGSWLPYSSEVYFKSTKARYFRLVAKTGTHACIAEIDILQNTDDFKDQDVKVLAKIDSGSWFQSTDITIDEGKNLTLRATALGISKWNFFGPNDYYSEGKAEYAISEITTDAAGIYTFLFTNQYNMSYKADVKVSVGAETGLAVEYAPRKEVGRKYYNLLGVETKYPQRNQVYIVNKFYEDNTQQTEKIIHEDGF